MQNKPVKCSVCGFNTSLYRVERDEFKRKIFICSKHPKAGVVAERKSRQDLLELWYLDIHKKFDGVCQETGRNLTFSKKHCAHILPKKRSGEVFNYSYFATDARNGILVSWDIHSIIDTGTKAQRLKLNVWPQICKIRKQLLEDSGLTYDESFWENATW